VTYNFSSSKTSATNRKLPGVRGVPLALAGLFMLLAAVQPQHAWAQAGRGAGPQGAPGVPGQNVNGMHIYIWGGLKSHGTGQHDYPQFLADWSKVLTDHGAVRYMRPARPTWNTPMSLTFIKATRPISPIAKKPCSKRT